MLPRDSEVFLNGTSLARKSSVKYLGYKFTSQLKFTTHAEALCHKASARMGFLFAKLHLASLPLPLVLQVFNTYILPIFQHGLCIWLPSISTGAQSRINAVFTKFLKRYLRGPKTASNGLTHFITQTQPLTLTLQNLLPQSYQSLILPSLFNGW